MSGKEVFVLSGTKYFILLTGNTLKSHKDFIVKLKSKVPSLQEVKRVEECDFILVFCPVVSQVGPDTERAVNKINDISGPKPAVLVVLHHTFDPECVVPESNRAVTRENTITVDCLFHEDQGLLTCNRNSEVFNYLKMQMNSKTQKTFWEGWWDIMKANKNETKSSTQPSETSASPNNQKAPEFKHADDKLHEDFEQLEHLRKKIFKKEEKEFVSNEVIIAAELKLVLLARTKSDKTAAKNIILGKEVAATSTTTSTAETENTQLVDGRKVTVVDTPDLFSLGMSLEEFRHIEGPHAFLLIIPVMNSEKTEHKEDKTQVSFFMMEDFFGDRFWRNTIIIFSVTDELQKKNIEEFIQSGDQELQELVAKCENRIHCLNIKKREDSQVSELLEKIETMVDRNGAKIYQIIGNMVMETALLKDVQHQMQKSLDKNEELIKQYEDDLTNLGTGQNSADHIKIINAFKEKCELKREVGEEIKKRYDRIVRMEENREFIRVILPKTMQTVWLSLSHEQNKYLDKKNELAQLKEWFLTNIKL